MQAKSHPTPIRLSLGYKVIWGIAALGTSLISGMYGALLPIFYQDYLGLTAKWIGIASAIYASLIRQRLGVVGAQQLLLLIAGIALILIPIVPGSLILVCLIAAGFGLSGPQTLTNMLFAQVADEDELRSGVRREGAFFGVNAKRLA